MLAVITASSREERTPALQPSEVQRRPRQRLLAVAGVALVLIAGIVGVGSTIRRNEPAWAAEAIAVAKSSPRYLLADLAWELIRADEFSAEQGEIQFSDGTRELDLRWTPVVDYGGLIVDRGASADRHTTAIVDGRCQGLPLPRCE